MATIQIRNIGPIKDTGTISTKAVNLIIGKQSSGKSTVMKILCFCTWIEKKVMVNGEELMRKYTHYGRFIKELKQFHHLDNSFFSDESEIQYTGECIHIAVKGGKANARIKKLSGFEAHRHNLKISFVPSERNMSSAIQNISKAYRSTDYDSLYNYLWEFDEAKSIFDKAHAIEMPFDSNVAYYYDQKTDRGLILLKRQGKVFETLYASSGIQSVLPIMVIVNYLTSIVGTNMRLSQRDITNAIAKAILDKEKTIENLSDVDLKKVARLLSYKDIQVFVEEIEQNLFPQAQFDVVKSVVKAIKSSKDLGPGSMIFMTSHSPYVLTTLNFLMRVAQASSKDSKRTSAICPPEYVLPATDYSAYWINGNGVVEDIVDHEYGFIKGDKLDEISEYLNEQTEVLNEILYG